MTESEAKQRAIEFLQAQGNIEGISFREIRFHRVGEVSDAPRWSVLFDVEPEPAEGTEFITTGGHTTIVKVDEVTGIASYFNPL